MNKCLFAALVGVASILAGPALAQSGGDRVVAKVGDEQITLAELQAEMPPTLVGNPGAQSTALKALVDRKILAQEALRQKLDKTPLGATLIQRADDAAIAGLLERKIAGPPPTVSEDQVRAFIAANPLMFANRRLISLDQFITDETNSDLTRKLEAANDMGSFEDVLMQNGVHYRKAVKVLDTLTISPAAGKQIAAMKSGAVFISPAGNGLALSGVTDNRAAPIGGAQAESLARAVLMHQAVESKVKGEVDKIVKAGQPNVQINDDYKPK